MLVQVPIFAYLTVDKQGNTFYKSLINQFIDTSQVITIIWYFGIDL